MKGKREHAVEAVLHAATATARYGVADADPPIGAHLVTPRLGYEHHGIYVGDGMVVHYGGFFTGLQRRPVELLSLTHFADGRPVQVRFHARARYSPSEVVARAKSRLGEDHYRLATNNCEHFCEWCLFGEARSVQVERLRAWPRMAALAAARRLKELVLAGQNIRPVAGRC